MVPRRPLFALDYILETVEIFSLLAKGKGGDPGNEEPNRLMNWANDVLHCYFAAVNTHPVVDSARGKFAQAKLEVSRDLHEFHAPTPLVRGADIATIEEFSRLTAVRKSVRWYEEKRVPRELLDRAVEIAGQSPSACNRQPYRFIIFDDPEDAAIVGAIPKGTIGFSDNFPCLIVVVGNVGAYFNERDRHVIYIDASLASMSLQFALVAMGLGCCCINWPDIRSQDLRIKDYVTLEETERVVMLISVGYPRAGSLVPYSAKKEIGLLRRYETLSKHIQY